MTLEEYKKQSKAIYEESANFNGTPEESVKFFEYLSVKYPEVNEFNTKAIECKDITEFKQLANSFGMEFSDDDAAEKLYSILNDSSMQIEREVTHLANGSELEDDELSSVVGGANWKKVLKWVGIGLAVVGAVAITGGAALAVGGSIGATAAITSTGVSALSVAMYGGAGAAAVASVAGATAAGGAVAAAAGTALAVGMDNLESAAGGVGSDDDIDDSLKIESEL